MPSAWLGRAPCGVTLSSCAAFATAVTQVAKPLSSFPSDLFVLWSSQKVPCGPGVAECGFPGEREHRDSVHAGGPRSRFHWGTPRFASLG
jgi:hypothetical protein